MKVLIKGAGISGMILNDILKTSHPNWLVDVEGVMDKPQNYPLLLDISQLECDIGYIQKGLKVVDIKVGYTDDGLKTITNEPTEEMLEMYYKKQGRTKTSSSMSNSSRKFKAMDLKDYYEYCRKVYGKYHNASLEESEYDIVFETKNSNGLLSDIKRESEYLLQANNDLKGFEYVYDCSNNNVKRYTSKATELLKPEEGSIKISNYYRSPKVLAEYDVSTNTEYIYISRNATKSQLKIVDAINYVNYRWGDR